MSNQMTNFKLRGLSLALCGINRVLLPIEDTNISATLWPQHDAGRAGSGSCMSARPSVLPGVRLQNRPVFIALTVSSLLCQPKTVQVVWQKQYLANICKIRQACTGQRGRNLVWWTWSSHHHCSLLNLQAQTSQHVPPGGNVGQRLPAPGRRLSDMALSWYLSAFCINADPGNPAPLCPNPGRRCPYRAINRMPKWSIFRSGLK